MITRKKIQLCGVGCLLANSLIVQAETKPNIVIFFADDISAREIPIYGSSVWTSPKTNEMAGGDTSDMQYRAQTPVLNKLANEGCWIKSAWGATISSPSRAMMMTGRYAHLHKWWQNGDFGKYTNEEGKVQSWPLYESSPLTIAHVAKQGGYATFWAGKTQMAGSLLKFGFDEGAFTPGDENSRNNPNTDFALTPIKNQGKHSLINQDTQKEVTSYAQPSWYWKPSVQVMNNPKVGKGIKYWPASAEDKSSYGLNTYGPDVELSFIFDFMTRKHAEGKPFFIYHTSHLGHDAFDFLHPDSGNKWPGTPKIEWKNDRYFRTVPNVTGDNGVYDTHGTITESGIHNQINYIDYQVWLYMNKLKELNIENNTVFIFCADNGTSGYGKASSVSQKGAHIPMIIYAPGMKMTKKGMQDILVNLADVLPTVADISKVKMPDNYEINGVSLWSYLTTSKKEHRNWIYTYKIDKQFIRGTHVLKDANEKWWDVSGDPKDLISFPMITDWSKVSEAHRAEKKELESILPRFDLYNTEHDSPGFKGATIKKKVVVED